MKLYEEFKEYENLWESVEDKKEYKPILIRIPKENKEFDITKPEEFKQYILHLASYDAERQFPKGTKYDRSRDGSTIKTDYAAYRAVENANQYVDILREKADEGTIDPAVLPELEKIAKEFETEYESDKYDLTRNEIEVFYAKRR